MVVDRGPVGGSASNALRSSLMDVLRREVGLLLSDMIEAEVDEFVDRHNGNAPCTPARVVRNGYLPARAVSTTFGEIEVRNPRVRDRRGIAVFRSAVLRPYCRRIRADAQTLLWLFLSGLSGGDMAAFVKALLGREVGSYWQRRLDRTRATRAEWLAPAEPDVGSTLTLVIIGAREEGELLVVMAPCIGGQLEILRVHLIDGHVATQLRATLDGLHACGRVSRAACQAAWEAWAGGLLGDARLVLDITLGAVFSAADHPGAILHRALRPPVGPRGAM